MVMDVGTLRSTATLDISDASKNIDVLASKYDEFEKAHSSISSKVQQGPFGGGGGGGGSEPGFKETVGGLERLSGAMRAGAGVAGDMGLGSERLGMAIGALELRSMAAAGGIAAVAVVAGLGLSAFIALGSGVQDTEAKFAAFTGTTTKGADNVMKSLEGVAKYGETSQEALSNLTTVAPKIVATLGGPGMDQPDALTANRGHLGSLQDLLKVSGQVAKTLGEDSSRVTQNVTDIALAYGTSGEEAAKFLENTAILTHTTTDEIAGETERAKKILGPGAPDLRTTGALEIMAGQAGIPSGRATTQAVTGALVDLASPKNAGLLAEMGVSTLDEKGMPRPDVVEQFTKVFSDPQKLRQLTGMSQLAVAKEISSDPYSLMGMLGKPGALEAALKTQAEAPSPEQRYKTQEQTPGGFFERMAKSVFSGAQIIGGGVAEKAYEAFSGNEAFNSQIGEIEKSPWLTPEDRKRISQGSGPGSVNPRASLSNEDVSQMYQKYVIDPRKYASMPGLPGSVSAFGTGVVPVPGSITQPPIQHGPDVPIPVPGSILGGMTPPPALKDAGKPKTALSNLTEGPEQTQAAGTQLAGLIQGQTSALTSTKELASAQSTLAAAIMNGDSATAASASAHIQVAQALLAHKNAAADLASQQGKAQGETVQVGTQMLQSQTKFDTSSPKMQQETGGAEKSLQGSYEALAAAKQRIANSGGSGQEFMEAQRAAEGAANAVQYYTNQLEQAQEKATGLQAALSSAFGKPTTEENNADVGDKKTAVDIDNIMRPFMHQPGMPHITHDAMKQMEEVVLGNKGNSFEGQAAKHIRDYQASIAQADPNINKTATSTEQNWGLLQAAQSGQLPSQNMTLPASTAPSAGAVEAAFSASVTITIDGSQIFQTILGNIPGVNVGPGTAPK